MPLDYAKLMSLPPIETRHDLTFRDTILYALGLGVAAESATDPGELQFVYEEGLKALPTMVVTLAYPGFWAKQPEYGLDWKKILQGEQSIEIHSRLPTQAKLLGVTKIDAIFDKGASKGAVICTSRKIYDEGSGRHLATARTSMFARGDGGYGGTSDGAPKPHPLPDRAPDQTLRGATSLNQALLYRLSGDYNPLHADPKIAKEGGFPVPILHGLCTFGVAGRLLLKALCGDDPERLKRLDVRFSAPVYPGETLEVDVWRETDGKAAYRARVVERDLIVLQNGYVELD